MCEVAPLYTTDKYLQYSSTIWPVYLNSWVFFYELSGCGFESLCSHLIFEISHLLWARNFLTFRKLQSVNLLQMCMWHNKNPHSIHHTDKYSQHNSIISPVWLNGWVFVYKLGGCLFKFCSSHLNFRFQILSKQFLDI